MGFCLFTTKEKTNNEILKVENNEIKGVLLYSIDINKKMIIKFFINKNNVFIENEISNIEIGYITSNEIVDFSKIFFKSDENTTILITNSSYKMIEHKNNNLLKIKLAKLIKTKYGDNVTNAPKTCGLGCEKNDGYPCALFNNGNMGCKEDKNCPKDEAEEELKSANNNSYNYSEITEDLYHFRSDYLLAIEGGEKIMNDYYELGKNLPLSFYSISNCIELFDLLENDVTSLTRNLTLNPNGSTILIDNSLKLKLSNYLLNIKGYYTEQADKEKIDKLINKLNFYSNKSNDFITKNLYLY